MASTTGARRSAGARAARSAHAPDRWAEGRTLLVELAGHAPSPQNTRPWRMRERSRGIDLLVDVAKVSRRGTESRRQALIACGAALFNLRLGVAQLGLDPVVTYPLDGDLLARVEPGTPRAATHQELDLLDAVDRRRTRRDPFERSYLPGPVRDRLAAAVAQEGAVLLAVPPGPRRDALDRAMTVAARLSPRDPARLRGLRADWPGSAPATIEALCTGGDTEADWLRAGEALQRLLLSATIEWVQVRFFSLALEHAELRETVRARVTAGLAPQLVLELGHAGPPKES